jgi:hypothetical protein
MRPMPQKRYLKAIIHTIVRRSTLYKGEKHTVPCVNWFEKLILNRLREDIGWIIHSLLWFDVTFQLLARQDKNENIPDKAKQLVLEKVVVWRRYNIICVFGQIMMILVYLNKAGRACEANIICAFGVIHTVNCFMVKKNVVRYYMGKDCSTSGGGDIGTILITLVLDRRTDYWCFVRHGSDYKRVSDSVCVMKGCMYDECVILTDIYSWGAFA